jgi:hypothetical protein
MPSLVDVVLGFETAAKFLSKSSVLLVDDRHNGGDEEGTFGVRQTDDVMPGRAQLAQDILILGGRKPPLYPGSLACRVTYRLLYLGRPRGIAGPVAESDRCPEEMPGQRDVAVVPMDAKGVNSGWFGRLRTLGHTSVRSLGVLPVLLLTRAVHPWHLLAELAQTLKIVLDPRTELPSLLPNLVELLGLRPHPFDLCEELLGLRLHSADLCEKLRLSE